jgi:hypothetical protein
MYVDHINEDGEYEPSLCCEKETDFYYPDTLTPSDPRFETEQILLQKAFLNCHRYMMSPSDLRRAHRTVVYLNKKLRGENGYW